MSIPIAGKILDVPSFCFLLVPWCVLIQVLSRSVSRFFSVQIFRKSGPHNFFDELNEDTEASSPAPPAFVEGGSGGPESRELKPQKLRCWWWWWAVRYICCVMLAVSQFPLSTNVCPGEQQRKVGSDQFFQVKRMMPLRKVPRT